ncbi:MAG: ABC transporter ATP-binding protein/permease [Erysipelotrichaceae bacterium]|nr:ABC transporter ATP-binding protein/permease [Erysipelotrichaceae bacterium]
MNRRMRPGGPNANSGEKGNVGEFFRKLLGFAGGYRILIIIAVVCAMGGSICTILGPDRLSDVTNAITEGITPDTDNLEEITTAMSDNVQDNMETLMSEISSSFDQESMSSKAAEILASTEISDEDKVTFQTVIASMSSVTDESEMQEMLLYLPDSILEILFDDIEVNGSTISASDQVTAISILSDMDIDADSEDISMDMFDDLADSIMAALFSDIEVEGTIITGADQQEMMTLLADVDTEDSSALLEALDELPESIYSLVNPSIDMDKIVGILVTLIILYCASFALSLSQHLIMNYVTQNITKKLRKSISHKINCLPMSYFNHTSTGDILSRITNDVDTIGQTLNQSIGTLVSAVTLFIGALIMMFSTNVIMSISGILATIIGFVLMMVIMSHSQKYFNEQQEDLGLLNGHVEEIYTGQLVVKAYNGEEKSKQTFDKYNQDLRNSAFRAQCLSGLMMPIMTFIGNFGYVVVCVVGAVLTMNDMTSFGTIVAFMIYIRLFTQPLSQIAQSMQSMQMAAAAGKRVFDFLEADEMEDESYKIESLGEITGDVEFNHVNFGYDEGQPIINDFSAQAKAGQKIAIVGPTGAGKTTMVNLLMRFYETNQGDIKIDGISTKDVKREEVHSKFSMVLQDTWLFEGTIRENLIYCSKNISDETMMEATKAVGLDHFIRTLPNGYDTVLTDNVNLSQGQKQQLTIARAMIANKPMLILDEATSSVDTRSEIIIQKAMDKLMENRTSFIIAHRLSTIKNSDLILVMNHGDIVETGTHDELLAKNGFYAQLYNSQFDVEEEM